MYVVITLYMYIKIIKKLKKTVIDLMQGHIIQQPVT